MVSIGVTSVALVASIDRCARASSEWRSISRTAHENLVKKNYLAAENGFEQAIATLQSENPKAEEIYSLKLLLVETYRQSKSYHKARELLSSMEPEIAAGNYFDPTITVRFWRRKAELEFSSGSQRLGIQYYRKAISNLEKHFDPNSPTLERNYLAVLHFAVLDSDLDTIVEYLNKLKKNDGNASYGIEAAFHVLYQSICKLLDRGDYREANRLVGALKVHPALLSNEVKLCIGYTHYAKARGHTKVALDMTAVLLKLLDEVKAKLPGRDGTNCQIEIHVAMGTAYSTEKDSIRKSVHHFKQALALSRTLAPLQTTIEQLSRASAIEGLVLLPGMDTEESLKLLQEPIDYSVLPIKESMTEGSLGRVRTIHVSSRVCAAMVQIAKKDPGKAEAALLSIDSETLKAHPVDIGRCLVAILYVDIAQLYKNQNNELKCSQALATAKELVKGLPDTPAMEHFFKKYKDVMGESKKKF